MGKQELDTNIIIQNILTMSIVDTPTWYIKVQACLYIVFAIIFKFKITNKRKLSLLYFVCVLYVLVCMCLGVACYWYFTVCWFPIGISIALHKEKLLNLFGRIGISMVLLNGVMLCGVIVFRFFFGNLGYPVAMDIFIMILFVVLLIVGTYRFTFLSYITQKMGQISLELYLIHSMMLTGYLGNWKLNSCVQYILYIIVAILLSVVTKFISHKIIGLFFGGLYDKRN